MEANSKMHRKGFLETFAGGAALFGVASLSSCQTNSKTEPVAVAAPAEKLDPADEWFDKLKAKKHSVVYDVPAPNGIFPFAWPRIFLVTNESTGSKAADCGVVVVLRHEAIPYALDNPLWEKYKFGESFKIDDPKTKKPSVRNPFWKPEPGDFKVPGVGEVKIGINELQDDGIMFCVCGMAIRVISAITADAMKLDAEDVRKDWMAGILPGIQVVPSGVWALGRAQEHGCGYIKV
jgi:intracellular sulfur oxidation DsrE/DsrF family protein